MIIDNNGLPRDSGSTDFMDSDRLAGMMAAFGHPGMTKDLIRQYVVNNQAYRYPFVDSLNPASNNPKNYTRDQLICLSAGLKALDSSDLCEKLLDAARSRWYRAQDTESNIPGSAKKFPNGADLLLPDSMNHLRMCAGQEPLLLGKLMLAADILYYSWKTPLGEPNQLMCMCVVAGPKWVKFMRKVNTNLDAAINTYWAGWRQEPEFANFLIQKFQ